MSIDLDDIEQAIESAAGAERQLGMTWEKNAVPSQDRIDKTRQIIRRFLDLLPEDMNVQELREAVGGIPR